MRRRLKALRSSPVMKPHGSLREWSWGFWVKSGLKEGVSRSLWNEAVQVNSEEVRFYKVFWLKNEQCRGILGQNLSICEGIPDLQYRPIRVQIRWKWYKNCEHSLLLMSSAAPSEGHHQRWHVLLINTKFSTSRQNLHQKLGGVKILRINQFWEPSGEPFGWYAINADAC